MDACWHATLFGSNEKRVAKPACRNIMDIERGRITSVSDGGCNACHLVCRWCQMDKKYRLSQSTGGADSRKWELEEVNFRLSIPGDRASRSWWRSPPCACEVVATRCPSRHAMPKSSRRVCLSLESSIASHRIRSRQILDLHGHVTFGDD